MYLVQVTVSSKRDRLLHQTAAWELCENEFLFSHNAFQLFGKLGVPHPHSCVSDRLSLHHRLTAGLIVPCHYA